MVDLLNAELGKQPSQIWRAVHAGLDVLKQGLIRRIGDGESTLVWNHNWIPRNGLMRLFASLVDEPPQLVSELIDHTMAEWREDLVRQVFIPLDAEAILQIPLCTRQVEDFWHGMMILRDAFLYVQPTR